MSIPKITCVFLIILTLSGLKIAQAERLILVDFGISDEMNLYPFEGWNTLLRHPNYTQYVNPDGRQEHWGITETDEIPENQWAYYGVKGQSSILFRKGSRVVATFYNRSDEYAFLEARLSFTDVDEPDPSEVDHHWFTMHNRFYNVDGEWMPPHSLVEMEFYIGDEVGASSLNRFSSVGDHVSINISKPYNDNRFVLTKIELADDADLTPPISPADLKIDLFQTTDGVSQNTIRLSWSPSFDHGLNATGVSRYLIYRNDELYDVVSEDDVMLQGNDLFYIDLSVEPNTQYRYSVTALDSAPFGLYPHGARIETRVGNESLPAGPVSITTGDWNAQRLLNPKAGFQYLGGFRLPPYRDEYWSYASGGLAYYPSGNPGYNPENEWVGSLYVYSHTQREISEINIPVPVQSDHVEDLPFARVLKEPVDLWPRIYDGDDPTIPSGGADTKSAGLAYHPRVGSVPELLYYGIANFYGSDPEAPSHGWFNLSLTDSGGGWYLGGLPPSNIYSGLVSKIAFVAPFSWADAYTGGRSLIVGDTFLSGGSVIAHGPSLYAMAPWESGNLPGLGGVVSAVNLLRYSEGSTLEKRVINFTRDEFGQGGAWLRAGDQSAVAISYRRSVGDTWYGDSLGNFNAQWDIPEPPMGSKGVCATRWKTGLMLYNPNDLAAVAQGNRDSWEPQPYAIVDFSRYSMRTDGGDGIAGAIAFDEENRRLYFIEHNGDPEYEWGYSLIHVWSIEESQPSAHCPSWVEH